MDRRHVSASAAASAWFYGLMTSAHLSSFTATIRSGRRHHDNEGLVGMSDCIVRWRWLVKVSLTTLVISLVIYCVYLVLTLRHHQHHHHNVRRYRQQQQHLGNSTNDIGNAEELEQLDVDSQAAQLTGHRALQSTLTSHAVSGSNSSMADALLIQEVRQRRMSEACDALQLKPWSTRQLKIAVKSSGVFYVDDRLRYIYCMVPKAACTTWTRVLLVASGQVRNKNPNAISQSAARRYRVMGRILRPLSKYSIKDIEYRLKNYFKFVFVRHPLDRLSSAFRDRLTADHKMPKQLYNRMVIKRYRDANTAKSTRQRDVQFNEFVRFIVDPANRPSGYNFHWKPQYDLCLPCQIRYDFVGHHETLTADSQVVLSRLGPRAARVQFPTVDPDNLAGSSSSSSGRHHRVNLSEKLAIKYSSVSAVDKLRLRMSVYANDFNVFGYD